MIDIRLSKKLFNEKYYQFLSDYSNSTEIYMGGSGSGKSVFVAQKILYKALNDKRKVLILRKVGKTQKESCWALMKALLSQWKIYDKCNIRISDMTITLPNGSIFLFCGLDDPERIKSIYGITDIWMEESTEFNEDDYEQLTLRIRSKVKNLQIFLSFNPISKTNWVYKRWFVETAVEHPFILKTTYRDNRFLPQDYIDRLENLINVNPVYYRIYNLGEFCSLDRLIYTNWEVKDFDYKEIEGDLLIGLDFGFSEDPTALVASKITKDEIYIFKEFYKSGLTNPEIARVIKALGLSKSRIIADSAEPKSIKELRDEGITRIKAAEKGPDSVRHGIQKLQQYKIYVHPDCMQTKTELENYSWKKDKKSGEWINEPIDDFNHILDALRYSLQCTKKKIKTIPKSQLGL